MMTSNSRTKPSPAPSPLLSVDTIHRRVAEMAQEISRDFTGKSITAICILKGGFVFFSDVIRRISVPLKCEFLATSSYGAEKKSSGEVKLTLDTKFPIENEDVIVFEDIVDSGLTLSYILNLLKTRRPRSIKLATLLFKPQALKTKLMIDYVGFEIENHFVVGYGLDFAGHYRNLPYVGILNSAE